MDGITVHIRIASRSIPRQAGVYDLLQSFAGPCAAPPAHFAQLLASWKLPVA